jgi:hypothetical protein
MPIVKTEHPINGQNIDILIEVDDVPPTNDPYADDNLRSPATNVLDASRDLFGEGVALARNCAAVVVENIRQLDATILPSAFEVQFAVKLSSEMGAIITKLGAEAQLQITMKWEHKHDSK